MERLSESLTKIPQKISSIDQELEKLEQSLLNHSQSQYYIGGYDQEIESEKERIRQLTDRRSELIVLENDIRRFLDEWSKKYLEITERIIDNNLSIERGKEEDSKITLKDYDTNQINKIHLKDNGIPLNEDENKQQHITDGIGQMDYIPLSEDENKQHSTEGKQFH